MATGKYNTELVQGDTFRRSPTMTVGASNVPVDLSGVAVSGVVSQGSASIPLTCSLPNAGGGVFRFEIDAATTATMALGQWKLQVKFTHPDNTVETVLMGQLVVVDNV